MRLPANKPQIEAQGQREHHERSAVKRNPENAQTFKVSWPRTVVRIGPIHQIFFPFP